MTTEQPRIEIGTKLKVLRETHGLSSKTVANFLGMHEDQITETENNKRQISSVMIERLCELYGCSSRDLFDLDNPPSIKYTHPLCEYEDSLDALSKVNRIAINQLEMQRIFDMGEKRNKDKELSGKPNSRYK